MSLNLIMLGPPGAGKGTQAERFARTRGIPKISTGDILREAVANKTDLGCRAKAVMERGELVSDEIMIGIVQERLNRSDVQSGFVLDGFPRTVPQAEALDRIMAARDPLIVVDIVVPLDELVRRLASRMVCADCGANGVPGEIECRRCGGRLVQRTDDNDAVVLERLRIYNTSTKPLVDFYRTRPTFRSIDGAQPPDFVAHQLAAAIQAAGNGSVGRTVPGGRP
jgi:adenylate kinase